jgi:NADPH:quinone reductase-like Zn-dependent oxidoreductase
VQAVRVHDGGGDVFESVPDPAPGEGEVVVELRFAAVNRRDKWVSSGTYPYPLPLILGSDGAGVRRDTGDEVVIYPGFGWPRGADHPPDVVGILGGPRDGTYAELVAVPVENLFPKPARLSWEEAAALPLAAITAYRALFSRARLRQGETVLVLGAGSGVLTLAVRLAVRAGAVVLVTSSSDEKIDRAKDLGARDGVNYAKTADWPGAVQELGGADVVIDSVGSTWQQSLECLRIGGRLVVLGATGGTEVPLQVRKFYFQHSSLLGTMLGGPDEMDGLLRMVEQGGWRPVIDSVSPLGEAADVLDRLVANAHFGKIVLACS